MQNYNRKLKNVGKKNMVDFKVAKFQFDKHYILFSKK